MIIDKGNTRCRFGLVRTPEKQRLAIRHAKGGGDGDVQQVGRHEDDQPRLRLLLIGREVVDLPDEILLRDRRNAILQHFQRRHLGGRLARLL